MGTEQDVEDVPDYEGEGNGKPEEGEPGGDGSEWAGGGARGGDGGWRAIFEIDRRTVGWFGFEWMVMLMMLMMVDEDARSERVVRWLRSEIGGFTGEERFG